MSLSSESYGCISDHLYSKVIASLKQTGCPNPNVFGDWGYLDYILTQKDDYLFNDMMSYCTKNKDGSASKHHKLFCCSSLLCKPAKCTLQNKWTSGKSVY